MNSEIIIYQNQEGNITIVITRRLDNDQEIPKVTL